MAALLAAFLLVLRACLYVVVPACFYSIVSSHSDQVEGRLALAFLGWFVLWCMT